MSNRVATFYLSDGREVDVYKTEKSFIVQNAYSNEEYEFSYCPTIEDVEDAYAVQLSPDSDDCICIDE